MGIFAAINAFAYLAFPSSAAACNAVHLLKACVATPSAASTVGELTNDSDLSVVADSDTANKAAAQFRILWARYDFPGFAHIYSIFPRENTPC